MSHAHASSTANLVGVHYRVGKKIGEGSFGVIFSVCPTPSRCTAETCLFGGSQGTNLLNSQTVAIKFVCGIAGPSLDLVLTNNRSRERLRPRSFVMSAARIESWQDAVSIKLAWLTLSYSYARIAGIPQIYHFGQEGLHNILVIDLLGPSLEDLFDMCGRKFSIKTVCMVAKQMVCMLRIYYGSLAHVFQLSRAQTIHEKNLIYRDIKV